MPRRLLIITLKESFIIKCQQSAHCSHGFELLPANAGFGP